MMNEREPVIRVKVDVTNPGQFLACCGLLELADRKKPAGVEGWFERSNFCLRGAPSILSLVQTLAKITPESVGAPAVGVQVEESIAPLRLAWGDTSCLMLDAWTKWEVEKRKPKLASDASWKFWSGNQGVLKIWKNLCGELAKLLKEGQFTDGEELLARKTFVKGRFGFDAQAAWNALDAGYSPNDQDQPVATRPALELLALVGLQRFRPAVNQDFQFEYSTWGAPLAPASARVAAIGFLTIPPATRFRAKIIRRGNYGGLSYATKLTGEKT